MNYSCLHAHTSFCDGSGTVEDFCAAAYKKKLVSLGFSAHAPITKQTGLVTDWHLSDGRFDEYCESVRAAKETWHGKLCVYLGLEVDFIENAVCAADFNRDKLGLDYLIGSVHYVTPSGTVDCSYDEFENLVNNDFGGDAMALADRYWDCMELMLDKGGFDIVGHADIVKKNNNGDRWFSQNDSQYVKRVERVASLIADSGIVTEINTGAMTRYAANEPYPSPQILRLLQQKGVPVTINADAHRPEQLDGFYSEARRLLLETGFTRHCLFQGRVDGKPVWKQEPL
ncbi:MAG: histidinol-phosphatase [Spirochaetaceae bacterium]|jgi:histidinol-phosphatase (PHP family)|nr:histidinol-phosphatase [Spirochaetaceae bacterium]